LSGFGIGQPLIAGISLASEKSPKTKNWVVVSRGLELRARHPVFRTGLNQLTWLLNMMISLVFLAPSLVKAAADGRLPDGLGVTRLCDLPPDWAHQYRMLGLSLPNPSHSNRVSR
jgi:hypothetical protein